MALKNINPTKTQAWEKLTNHFNENKNINIKDLCKDKNRTADFSLELGDLSVDFSKNRITKETIALLVELAKEVDLKDAIEKQYAGAVINVTEGREVLHTALRSNSEEPILIEGKNIKPQIQTALRKIRSFSNKVISGKWKGYSGKSITDIVNIGIGGSDLGPDMVVESLQYYKNQLTTHFVSNVDGDHVSEVIKKLNPETTLFVIVSKTFTTQETITNAETLKNWFLKSATIFDIPKHFVAVSTNLEAVDNFGIDKAIHVHFRPAQVVVLAKSVSKETRNNKNKQNDKNCTSWSQVSAVVLQEVVRAIFNVKVLRLQLRTNNN